MRRVTPRQAAKERAWHLIKVNRIANDLMEYGWVCCDDCGKSFSEADDAMWGLHAHHKQQRSLGGAFTDENMQLLCPEDHEKAHSAEGLARDDTPGRTEQTVPFRGGR